MLKNKELKNCRVCDSTDLTKYLDLGMIPLVNQLGKTKEEALNKDRFSLEVLFCNDCGLSQLSQVVNPEIMFSDYPYRSGVSKPFVEHCNELAKYCIDKFNITEKDTVMDIASNDGTLLKSFHKKKINVLGIEPAKNLAEIANIDGISTLPEFWDHNVAERVVEVFGKMKLILGTNVFAHVDHVIEFLFNAKNCLAKDGAIVLEFPYLMNLIKGNAFDTVYHEHLSYFSARPLQKLAEICELRLIDITETDIHGGSVRVEYCLKENTEYTTSGKYKFFRIVEKVDGYDTPGMYLSWGNKINSIISDIKNQLDIIKQSGKSIAAFGAAAKGCILLNSIQANDNLIDYIVDDTPEKIGKYSPGTGIPIVSRVGLEINPTDYLLILPWNFKKEIIENTYKVFQGRNYIIPFPKFEIIER